MVWMCTRRRSLSLLLSRFMRARIIAARCIPVLPGQDPFQEILNPTLLTIQQTRRTVAPLTWILPLGFAIDDQLGQVVCLFDGDQPGIFRPPQEYPCEGAVCELGASSELSGVFDEGLDLGIESGRPLFEARAIFGLLRQGRCESVHSKPSFH
jgi:hypothetical protein